MCEQRSWMRGRRKAIAYGQACPALPGRPCGVRMQGHSISFVAASHQPDSIRRRAEFRKFRVRVHQHVPCCHPWETLVTVVP